MKKHDKIFIAGHKGMVGSTIKTTLVNQGFTKIITVDREELDLINQNAVNDFLKKVKPNIIILAAAKVGGINANITSPGAFIYENLQIQNNLIHYGMKNGVKKIIYLGSSCIYPKNCPQPIKEEYLLTGPLEPTNEGYALAKIAGLKMLEFYNYQYGLDYTSLMPCNLYGPGDSFDLKKSHVLSALVKRFSDAKDKKMDTVELWGSGAAKREFMHVKDLANAVLHFGMMEKKISFVNVGWGKDISIYNLAHLIGKKTGYNGEIRWDESKPDGMLRKCMDVRVMESYGFEPSISLDNGIEEMINIYNKEKI